MKVDILVLNYNGKPLLEKFLPSICRAARNSSTRCGVHVVDNKSGDGSVEFLRRNFPDVTVHVAEENRVLCSYNDVVRTLTSDVMILLNNDIKVEPDFADVLVRHFKKDDVMFAAPRLMNFDNTYNGGRSYLEFDKGAIKVVVDAGNFKKEGKTCAISTGAFRRKTFLELGGFDDLYLPGIWEDVDICFRGLARGWKGVYEPGSVIWHDEGTTFHREYGRKKKMAIAHRNMFLFFWKNIRDGRMLFLHAVLTLPRVLLLYLTGNREPLEGLIAAFKKLPEALEKRKYLKNERKVLEDKELIT